MGFPTLRPATVDDAEQLARVAIDGFEVYRDFAPPDWEPPPVEDEITLLGDLLVDESTWCRLAEVDGRVVGQVTFLPAARSSMPVDQPGLAHLRNLFVDREYWGSGLATELHGAAIVAARERGFSQMRLFTPAEQARARRFYEREGWAPAGDEFHAPGPDLVIVEYRYRLEA
jgi:GNAT superfamily N-acetyltransferase